MSESKIKQQTSEKATEIVCILDRSGSMDSIKHDAIGAFNSFLNGQKKLPSEAYLTLVLFDDEYELLYDSIALNDVPELTESTFIPRGMTALLDAIGQTIKTVKKKTKDKNVIVCILTDGEENHSNEYKHADIIKLIRKRKEKHHWEFIFLAANQDAIQTGNSLGINASRSVNFSADKEGMKRSMDITSYATAFKRGHHTEFSSSEKYENVSFDAIDDDFLAAELNSIMKGKSKK